MTVKTTKEEYSPPLKTWGARHVQCLLLFLGMAVSYTLKVCMSVAIVAMKNAEDANPDFPEYQWDQNTSGYILTSFFWGYVVAQIPCGHLVTFISPRKLLVCGVFLSSTFNMLVPVLADVGVVPLIASRVAVGLFQGCLMPCCHTLLSRWVPPSERSRLGTFVINGTQFGTVMTMPITGFLVTSSIGWPSVFYIFGSAGILWSIVFYFLGSDRPSDHPSICPREADYINESVGNLNKACSGQKLKVPWKSVLTSVPIWTVVIAHCGHNWGSYTLLTEMPTYMKNVLELDTAKVGKVAALPYLARWILGFPISFIADYALRKGVSTETVRKCSNSVGLWIPAISMVVLCVISTTNIVTLVAILVVTVGFNSGTCCGFAVNHIDLSPNFAGTLMSITNFFANILGIVAPLVCSAITNKDEDDPALWHIVFYITAGIYFVANLIFVIFGKAEVQPWNEPEGSGDASSVSKRPRFSVISLPGELTSLAVPVYIEDKEQTPC